VRICRPRAFSFTILLALLVLANGCATSRGPEAAGPSAATSPPVPGEHLERGTGGRGEPSGRSYSRREEQLLAGIEGELLTGTRIDPDRAGRLTALMPDSSYARYLAGSVYLRNGDLEKAADELTRSLELDPDNARALSALGDISSQTGDLTKADLYYSRAYESAPSPETANRLALLRIQGGYLESARNILVKTLSEDPGDVMTRNNLAIALDMMGATSEGIEILSSGDIVDPRLLNTRALLQLKEGRPERAVTDLRSKPGEENPGRMWLLLGIADLQQGRLEQAEERFRAALASEPSGYEGYLDLGLTLRRQGKYSEAQKVYLEGLARAPNPDLHLNLGILYELYRGEPSLALQQYRQYVSLGGPASDRVRGWVEYLEGVVENP